VAAKNRFGGLIVGLVIFACAAGSLFSCGEKDPKLTASPNRTEGTGVYVILDVSGSMEDSVPNAQGVKEGKLLIAKRAALDVCKAIDKYAQEDKSRKIMVAVADFSDTFELRYPMNTPDVPKMEKAINEMHTQGGTAIGDAVLAAQKDLDLSRLKHQHILVITDGENNEGVSPEAMARAINKLPEDLRPSVYVVAFDVNAGVFDKVKKEGWQVFSAADGKQLQQQLDEVVGGHILIEK